MTFLVTFFNDQYAEQTLNHFKKQGFSSSLESREVKGNVCLITYRLERERKAAQ